MITDEKQCREILLGNGTTIMGTAKTTDIYDCLYIVENDKCDVGQSVQKFSGMELQQLNNKSILLKFDGPKSIQSIDMMIDYLKKIKKNLIGNSKEKTITCKGCKTKHDVNNKTYFKLVGELYIGQDGGILNGTEEQPLYLCPQCLIQRLNDTVDYQVQRLQDDMNMLQEQINVMKAPCKDVEIPDFLT